MHANLYYYIIFTAIYIIAVFKFPYQNVIILIYTPVCIVLSAWKIVKSNLTL